MNENNTEELSLVSIQILDRSYKIKCPSKQIPALQESAVYLDEQMRKIRQTTSANNIECMAVAALNITHEFIQLQAHANNEAHILNQRLQDLQRRIENCLATNEETTV